jgi:hypothetical protein
LDGPGYGIGGNNELVVEKGFFIHGFVLLQSIFREN